MMRRLVDKVATCHIFWAADFLDITGVVTSFYSDIYAITNYHHFKAQARYPKNTYFMLPYFKLLQRCGFWYLPPVVNRKPVVSRWKNCWFQ